MNRLGRSVWVGGLLFVFGVTGCSGRLVVQKRQGVQGGPDASIDTEGGSGGAPSGGSRGDGGVPPSTGGEGGSTLQMDASAGVHGGSGGIMPVTSPETGPPEPELDAGYFQCRASTAEPVVDRWVGNPSSCPATHPEFETPCLEQGLICQYPDWESDSGREPNRDHFIMFRCMTGTAAGYYWTHGPTSDNYYDAWGCPYVQPVEGAPCDDPPRFGLCTYPNAEGCRCTGPAPDAGDLTWTCSTEYSSGLVPPGTLDTTRRVSDLTPAERRAWCEWFSCMPQSYPYAQAAPPNVPVSRDGYTHTQCSVGVYDGFGVAMSLPRISIPQCEANLAFSQCPARVSDLDDCALWFLGNPPWARGCSRYLNTPGCSGTIVNKPSLDTDGGISTTGSTSGGGPIDDDRSALCAIRVR